MLFNQELFWVTQPRARKSGKDSREQVGKRWMTRGEATKRIGGSEARWRSVKESGMRPSGSGSEKRRGGAEEEGAMATHKKGGEGRIEGGMSTRIKRGTSPSRQNAWNAAAPLVQTHWSTSKNNEWKQSSDIPTLLAVWANSPCPKVQRVRI